MPTLPNMGLITPTLGGDSGVWDDKLNAALGLIDPHDHTSGKGVAITPAAMNINADLAFGGHAATGLGKAAFTAVTALTAGAVTLFVSSADNELYWRTNSGTNVKLTAGTSINTTLVGGIVGDYTAVSAQVAFDDANDRYTFKQNSATGWAKMACGDVHIYEAGTSESVYVGLKAPGALAASYDITWPVALPGSTLAVQISAAGLVSFSSTFSGALTATDFRYSSNQTLQIPGAMAIDVGGSHTKKVATSTGMIGWTLAASVNKLTYPIPLRQGDTIDGYFLRLHKDTDNTNTVSARMYRYRSLLDDETALGAGASSSANAPGPIFLTESGLNATPGPGYQYYLVVTPGGGVAPAADNIQCLEVLISRQ